MTFPRHLAEILRSVLLFSIALGLMLAIALLFISGVEGSITVDIDLGRSDAPWFLLGTPLVLSLLVLVASPVSYLLLRLWQRLLP